MQNRQIVCCYDIIVVFIDKQTAQIQVECTFKAQAQIDQTSNNIRMPVHKTLALHMEEDHIQL